MRTDDRGDRGRAALAAALIALLILLCASHGAAEAALLDRTGIDVLAEASRELGGADVRKLAERLLAGEWVWEDISLQDLAARFAGRLRAALTDALAALAAPVLAGMALRALLGARGDAGPAAIACRLACAALLAERFLDAKAVADAALAVSARWIDAAAPVVASAMALTGAGQRAAILTPSAALCAKLIADALRGWGLGLCSIAATVAVSANLSERFRLGRLFSLLRRAVQWGVGLLTAGFVGMLSMQGLLAAGQDMAAERAVSQVIRAALPIIGGEVSASSGVLLGSALALRSAVGVAGMLAGAGICAAPIAKLLIRALSLKLAAAVMEPVADPGVARIAADFAQVMDLLVAVCVGGVLMGALCLGAFLSLGG